MSKFHLSMTNNSFCHRFMKYDFPTYTHALNIQKQLSSAVQRRIRFLLQLESFIFHIRLNVVRKKKLIENLMKNLSAQQMTVLDFSENKYNGNM